MKRILPVIVISQFFCTSLWFAGNAVMADVAKQFHLEPVYLAYLTSAVQLGFIAGTLFFAMLGIADKFSPVKVFFVCAMIAAFFNLGICLPGTSPAVLLLFRGLTGFLLAGIYPVGMKIASDHYQQGLGKPLGFLVGALVIGTSFPHLLKSIMATLPWKYVIFSTSALAISGGLALLLWVPDGPYRKAGSKLNPTALLRGFRNLQFRSAAFGYFGHMWELYTFWTFVPTILNNYKKHYRTIDFSTPLLSFLIIAAGAVACACSGIIAQYFGARKTAIIALLISCTCCLISPFALLNSSAIVLIVFLFTWGMAVITDSPLFSTLVAQNAPQESKGTSLTIVNCIGFAITIVSIQLINWLLSDKNGQYIYMLLAIGPVLGLIALKLDSKSAAPLQYQPTNEFRPPI
jgi:MFS family permease